MRSIHALGKQLLLLSLLSPLTQAVSLTSAPSLNLDLSSLGTIALAGDFDAISIYQYTEQTESITNNGSQSVIAPLPDAIFADLASADASISAMCNFVMQDGTAAGIVVAGNFTSLGSVDAAAIALVDPDTGKVTALPGIEGTVSALLCDQDTNSVYVGGSFKAADSTNAIAWVGTSGWANLAFAGFNGPVTSISKAPSGHIVFGGSFSGLGNTSTPAQANSQVINIQTADLTTGEDSTTAGFDSASNIVCPVNGTGGSGSTWLAADNTAASWQANMNFGYVPTMLRMYNTDQDGRGTKTFRMTALPLNGIMNFTYTDASGNNASCTSQCPLAQNTSAQDFTFVNTVGMSGFRIDISDWYGDGAGLNGIELFEDDIYAYAVNDFNEPTCASQAFGSASTTTGTWTVTPSGDSSAEYLTAVLDSSNSSSTSVVFKPDIQQAGNYSVTFFTPGCQQSNTCSSRGVVNVTGLYATTGTEANQPQSTTLYQTNDFEKYDTIFMGYVDAASDSFRPTVTLTPSSGSADGMEIVASRVRFQLLNTTSGLNGLYEFNPNEAVVNTDFSESAIDRAGTDLNSGATVNVLLTVGDSIFAAGAFTDDVFENIMKFSDNQSHALADNGLNAAVASMYSYDGLLYIGGNFTNTSQGSIDGLSNIAAYSIADDKWSAIGAGVNGPVNYVVPLQINVSSSTPETTIAFSGDFTETVAFGSNAAVSVDGFAIWVPSKSNWLQNVKGSTNSFSGQLTTYANATNSSSHYLAGTLNSEGMTASGAVSLQGSSGSSLSQLPINIASSDTQSTLTKRSLSSSPSVNGVVTGSFYENDGRNVTILAGHFTATATNGSTINNIMFLNGSNNDAVTGFATGADSNSTIYAVAVQDDTLFVGGLITGDISGTSVNGLVLYDLYTAEYLATQPPALSGGDEIIVNAIEVQPSGSDVYVGGNFTSAGSLGCPSVCVFETTTRQWVRPGTGLSGSVTSLLWASSTKLVAAGNLTIDGNATAVATYDTKKQEWSASTALSSVPGPVTAMTAGTSDASKMWITGTASNGSAYLIEIDGTTQRAVGNVFGAATDIRGLLVLQTTKSHGSTNFLSDNEVLLMTGLLELPNYGNASAAVFNGTTIEPFILSTSEGEAGSLSKLISSNSGKLAGSQKHHSKGIVILVALCAALGCLFLIILIGFIIERVQRRRQGYSAIPSTYTDKNSNLGRVPPEHLFSNLSRGGDTDNFSRESFENIYLDLQKQPGKCRFAESGLGWKPSGGGDTFTVDGNNIGGAQWSRASKGYELKIYPKSSGVLQLDGFEQEDFDRISKAFKIWYGINVDNREHALRGWNWGKTEFTKEELTFNVSSRPAFEIPFTEVSNTNLAGKNEVAVEFKLGDDTDAVNGHKAGTTRNTGHKAAAGRDELVEMRFYIPGTIARKPEDEGEVDGAEDEEYDQQNAANHFYDTLIEKAQIGEVAGDTFATFLDILHLTPRGRFDIDMYESSFRLRGKTYDYKIQYQSIKKFFLLPKPDETHTLITLGLDPPLRQGQTRYPFIVMQLKLDEEVTIDLNMTEEQLQTTYKDKLEGHYEAPIHHVFSKVFKGLSGKKIIMPSKDFISHHNTNGIKCSIKANEGILYCLDKSFMFVPKPATYVQIENIASITMSRVGGAISASRTFDITMTMKGGAGEHQFSNINREEQQPLEDFFRAKNIRFKNEMMDDSATLLAAAGLSASDDDSDDAVALNRGSADEDEESVDEDFQADSDSDVAEEFDSAHESDGGSASGDDDDAIDEDDDDVEMDDADGDIDDDEDDGGRAKKKVRK